MVTEMDRMLLHLGADVVIEEGEVVGIFDLDNSSTSKRTRAFLADAQRKGEVINVSIGELPKSFVVCTVETTRGRGQRVYISPIASSTLRRRALAPFSAFRRTALRWRRTGP